ncbi:hypothetical protein PTKIN_Ptkin14bG0090200 [Pterospermum kingtungense]
METARKFLINKSLKSLKKRVKKKEKQVKSWKAQIVQQKKEIQHKNLQLERLHHEFIQMKQLIRSLQKSDTLANDIVEATLAAFDD